MMSDELMSEYLFSDGFKVLFIRDYWESKPGVFDYPASSHFVSLEEVFDAVTLMAERGPSDRLWIAKSGGVNSYDDFRMLQHESINLFGPKANDKDAAGFFSRMKPHSFGLNVHSLGSGKPAIDRRMSAIINDLALPDSPRSQQWVSDTFWGTYQATPFGIHRDPASVFVLCLLGDRTYYTWPMDYFSEGHQDLHNPSFECVERHLEAAEVFEVTAGQAFYWPSNRWHVATSNGEPSVVAQISAYFDPRDLGR